MPKRQGFKFASMACCSLGSGEAIMNVSVACRRLLASAALLNSLSLRVEPAAATTTLHEHDYWASTLDTDEDGHHACGVRTEMRGGGELRLMVIDNDLHLIAHDPDWNLRRGDMVRVLVYIDSDGFAGVARVVNNETLMVTNLSEHFLDQFIDGTQMVMNFGGNRWQVSLIGSSRAIGDMQACIASLHHLPMS